LQQLRQEDKSSAPATTLTSGASELITWRSGLWLSAIVLVAACGIGIYSWFRTREITYFEHPEIAQLTTTGLVALAAISRDGKYVAYATGQDQQSLHLRQVATGTDLELLPAATNAYSGITFSPDNAYIYYTKGITYDSTNNFSRSQCSAVRLAS
jgi:dipeptidyl aminopeptidase/acylaminoacyl peptidase